MNVNVGKFKDKINIVRFEIIYDENGFEVETEIIKHTLRCEYQTITSKEFYYNNNLQAEEIGKFLCRKKEINILKDFVVFNGDRYDIQFKEPINSQFMKLHCKMRSR